MLCSALAACESDAPPEPTTKEGQQRLVEGLAPVEPRVRLRRALGQGEPSDLIDFDYDHRGTEAEAASLRAKAEIAENAAKDPWPESFDEETTSRVVFAAAGAEYEYEFSLRELAALGALTRARGVNDASTDAEERDATAPGDVLVDGPDAVPHGWSNGIDSRDHKEISTTYPANQRELRRIGRFGSGCTGVMVGRRLVLTAAHCVVQRDLSYTTHEYRARRSNATVPYGTVTSEGYIHDSAWVSNDCHLNRAQVCHQHDWALVILPDDVWSGSVAHPGWMGYSVVDWDDYEATPQLRENGYPNHWSCHEGLTALQSGAPSYMLNLFGVPISTRTDVPYGQNFSGTVRDQQHFVSGHPRLVHFSNDISCGHSGGAIWSDAPGINGPYALGVNAYERCAGGDCGNATGTTRTHPNGARALTPDLADLIAQYRVSHP